MRYYPMYIFNNLKMFCSFQCISVVLVLLKLFLNISFFLLHHIVNEIVNFLLRLLVVYKNKVDSSPLIFILSHCRTCSSSLSSIALQQQRCQSTSIYKSNEIN